jgi:preprotein translocase subunit SecF
MRQSRKTYAELANLAVNQTLVRSINTSIVALLPVGVLLAVSVVTLGNGDLKDLSLSLFVGMAAGAYSSIFIATPLVVQLKASEKAITEQDRRAKARARREADRYADVPAFPEDIGMTRETFSGHPVELDDAGVPIEDEDVQRRVVPVTPPRRPEATNSGRVVPERKAPVRESGSAKRNQPTRQPRSKRGK